MRTHPWLGPLSLAASISLLTACGGGGGGSDTTSSEPSSAPDQVTLSGRAVKGTLVNAEVKIYSLNEFGGHAELLWTGQTDEKGSFRATLNNPQSLVDIVVTALPGQTQMRCDIVDGCGDIAFGALYTLDETFELERTANPETERNDIAVTPWTRMATKRTKELVQQGQSLEEASRAALSETSDILGIDISLAPGDITDTDISNAQQAQYAVANAALAELLSEHDSFENGLKKLAESFADGKFVASDAIKIGEIKSKLTEVVTAPELADNPAIAEYTEALNLIADSLPDDELDPEPSDISNQGLAKTESFKSFVKQVRTWVTQIEQTNFRSPLELLQIDTETVARTLNETSSRSLDQFTFVFTETANYIAANPELVQQSIDTGSPLVVPLNKSRFDESTGGMIDESVGQVSVTVENHDGRIRLSASSDGQLVFDGGNTWIAIPAYTMETSIPFNAIENGTINAFMMSGENNYVTLDGELKNQSGYWLRIIDGEATFTLGKPIASNDLSESKVEERLQAASVKGKVAILGDEDNIFSGDIVAQGVKLDVPSFYANTLKKVDFKGTFFGATGRFDAELSVTLNNAESFDPFGTAEHYGDGWRFGKMSLRPPVTIPVTDALEALVPKTEDEFARSMSFWSYTDYTDSDAGIPVQEVWLERSMASGELEKTSIEKFTVMEVKEAFTSYLVLPPKKSGVQKWNFPVTYEQEIPHA